MPPNARSSRAKVDTTDFVRRGPEEKDDVGNFAAAYSYGRALGERMSGPLRIHGMAPQQVPEAAEVSHHPQ